jgi:hypothetical protein
MLYAILTVVFFVGLSSAGLPTFYDKLLPVPFMNVLVRSIDRATSQLPLARFDPVRLGAALSLRQRNIVYTSLWAAVFIVLSTTQSVGDTHPGQYLPFWQKACERGSERACSYAANLTAVYCNTGSGWACNEVGILRVARNQSPAADFKRACELGFAAGCQNMNTAAIDVASLARGGPTLRDLPLVLRGTKPPLRERDPARLYAIGCAQGWEGMCGAAGNQ